MKKKLCFLLFLCIVHFFVAEELNAQTRQVTLFNDGWLFKKGPFPDSSIDFIQTWDKKWESVKIPHTWNAKDMQEKQNNFYAGEAYYKKSFFAADELKEKQVFLKFEGVGQVCELYVNGSFVGIHRIKIW